MFDWVLNTGYSDTTKKELYIEHLFLELLCYIFRFQSLKVFPLKGELVPKFVLESLFNKVLGLQSVTLLRKTSTQVFSGEFCKKLKGFITFFVALQSSAKKLDTTFLGSSPNVVFSIK